MSKYVKELVTDSLKERLSGVNDAFLVSVAGMNAGSNHRLRMQLRAKKMHLLVIKNSLARLAAKDTPLAAAFENIEGPAALVWGGDDVVALAKEITKLSEDKEFQPFAMRGGVLDGQTLTSEDVKQVSKWPSREEQLSILVGQILSPGANLASQLTSVGGALASQIKQQGEEDGEEAVEAPSA
ncbi:MAG: 50S ribosomal protein L10 [Pirellulales bacterium]|nr:50S ribosomal protein L10 [Pirellulales bacterium]